MYFRFGTFEINIAVRELKRDQATITLEPKAFDVLCFLVENSNRVVRKDELIDAVWQGRFTSDNALSTAIKVARQAVGDDGTSQHTIRTVHGQGFRFIAELESHDTPDNNTLSAELESKPNPSSSTTNLKRRRLTLVGREAEKAAIANELVPGHVASLVGPGGVGKTVLAVDVGLDLQDKFAGGVWFCELAPVQEDQVRSAVLGAIDSSAGAGEVDAARIVERFGDAATLVVLDNCEHVIESAAQLAEELLNLAPNLALLVTSREALEIPEEKIFRLEGLSYTDTDSVAVELFFHCAQQVTSLSRDVETIEIVRQITERLEGLPLAIELAASQLASSTVAELLHALGDQLSILASRRRGGEKRHSAMDDTIAWSYHLLEEEQRVALVNLSIFSGQFTVQAAEAVCDKHKTRAILHDLVAQSMLAFVPGSATSRFRLLEPIRQFVTRQLESEQLALLQKRHADWFASRVHELAQQMRSANEIDACEALTTEWSDIGRALAWGREHKRADIAVEPLLALHIHLLWQFRLEAFGWLESGVAACRLSRGNQARADVVRAMGAWSAGNLKRCGELIDSSIALAGESIESAYIGFYLAFAREDFKRVVQHGEKARELALKTEDSAWHITTAAFLVCGLSMHKGDTAEIPSLVKEVEKGLAHHPWPSGRCCELLAQIVWAFARGAPRELERYRAAMEEAADRCHAPWFKVTAAGMENPQKRNKSDAHADLEMYTNSAKSAIASGDMIQLPTILRLVAVCLVDLQDFERAAKLCGLIPGLRGLGEKGSLSPGYDDAVLKLRTQMSDEHFVAYTTIGRKWQLSDVVNELEAAVDN